MRHYFLIEQLISAGLKKCYANQKGELSVLKLEKKLDKQMLSASIQGPFEGEDDLAQGLGCLFGSGCISLGRWAQFISSV